ncbi:MAG: aminopeptidase [Anaeromyxobacteraceae bacterium]
MANSKSKHIRVKNRRRQQWKAAKKRKAATAKTSKK